MALATLVFLSATQVLAGPVDPVNKTGHGVAVKGYDVVAYFKQGKPVKGSAQFSTSWMGAAWWFTSSEDRDAFVAKPEQYAPQYGGYCSWAVSKGYTAEIDPEAWRIIDGKLYLNYSKDVQRKWAEDVQKRIAEANKNWPGLHK